MDTRKKEILKLAVWIGVFIAVLVYIWFISMENSYIYGFSPAFFFGIIATIGSYVAIQNSIPKNYPISKLTRKIIISVVMFFGIWFLSSSFMIDYWDFDNEIGVMLGLILAGWTAHYYAVGRQAKLKRREKEAKAKVVAEKAKIAKEKSDKIQKEEAAKQKKQQEITEKINIERKLDPDTSLSLDGRLNQLNIKLSNSKEQLEFTVTEAFTHAYPKIKDVNHKIARWTRSISSLSDKERIALMLLILLRGKGIITAASYNFWYGSIVYNNGQCAVNIISDYKGLNSSHYKAIMNVRPSPETSDNILSFLLKEYDRLNTQFPYIDKYFTIGASWFNESNFDDSRSLQTEPTPYSLLLGTLKNTDIPVYFDSDESLITIAPPGAGKTQCNVLANLTLYEAPAIILDVKGDCYKATAKHRERLGQVYRFSPLDIENSAHYNPLDFISLKEIKIWEDAQKLVKLIIVPDQKADHWDKRAVDVLTAIIAYVKLEEDEKTMTRVCDFASATPQEFEKLILVLTESKVNGMRRAGNALESMLENNPKQFEGVLDTLRGHLGAWQGDNVSAVTDKSDWHLEDFMKEKGGSPSLYLIIPPAEIETYAPVLRVIIGQHLSHFLSDHENIAEKPILFMLDEMPRLGGLDLIPQAQDTGRSYNIKLWMFAQYIGQLRKAYGKDIADGMIGAAGARIYMNPSDDNADELSKQLGECEDVILDKKIPLASATNLKGKEFRDDIVVMVKGENPLRLNKVFFGNMEFTLPRLSSDNVVKPEVGNLASKDIRPPLEDA